MTGTKFEKLVEIMATLRGPNGCPWDKQQDHNTLKPMLVEETYEVLEAVDNNDSEGLREELGDLLLHIVFHAQLGKEAEKFNIDGVIARGGSQELGGDQGAGEGGKAEGPDSRTTIASRRNSEQPSGTP